MYYCIACKKFAFEEDFMGDAHIIGWIAVDDYNECFGPFTYCPPPPLDDMYWEWVFSQENMIEESEM